MSPGEFLRSRTFVTKKSHPHTFLSLISLRNYLSEVFVILEIVYKKFLENFEELIYYGELFQQRCRSIFAFIVLRK